VYEDVASDSTTVIKACGWKVRRTRGSLHSFADIYRFKSRALRRLKVLSGGIRDGCRASKQQ
jgi:hypothetical protein